MSENLVSKFAECLIRKTLASEVKWCSLEENLILNGERITDLLNVCEFHTIHYFESYFCALLDGFVFLVNELNESARDSRFDSEGLNLYVQISSGELPVSVMFDSIELYRLKNAIESHAELPQQVAEFMEAIIHS